jgi:hypothetical protein
VSDYGLDYRAIGVRSPAAAKDFSSILCPDRIWGPPSLLPVRWVPGVLSPGVKARPGRDAEWKLYLLSPQAPPWRVAGLLYLLHSEEIRNTPITWMEYLKAVYIYIYIYI